MFRTNPLAHYHSYHLLTFLVGILDGQLQYKLILVDKMQSKVALGNRIGEVQYTFQSKGMPSIRHRRHCCSLR